MVKVEVGVEGWARPYQKTLIEFFQGGGRKAYGVWHRKAGKDRVATFIEAALCFKKPGLYWHALPKYEDARKVIWDAITPDGKRLVDWTFPKEIIRKRLDHEMKIELVNGSIWQPVGADNYDSLVGAFPAHVTYSEYAIMNPQAREFLRPALAMNDGTELIITTPRGFNHAFDLWQYAKTRKEWYTSLLTVHDTNVMSQEALDEEKRSMPEELFRQEYECDWSAANVGSIFGRYIEAADKEGRVSDDVEYDPEGSPLEISSDIGRRHISAWWFWQPQVGGYQLVDYDEDSGLDAQEWIDRLQALIGDRKLKRIWLPHDAKAKTFNAQHSAVEQFLKYFGAAKIGISPKTTKDHSINAGRTVLPKCRFNATRCKAGLGALRAWAFEYDEIRKQYSKEPIQDWSTDASDAFCEGAKIMQQREVIKPKLDEAPRGLVVGANTVTLNEMWAMTKKKVSRY